MKYTCKKEH